MKDPMNLRAGSGAGHRAARSPTCKLGFSTDPFCLISPSAISHRMTLKRQNIIDTTHQCRTKFGECISQKAQAKPTAWPQLLLFSQTLFKRGILQKPQENVKTEIPKERELMKITIILSASQHPARIRTPSHHYQCQYHFSAGNAVIPDLQGFLLPSCCAQLTSIAKLC